MPVDQDLYEDRFWSVVASEISKLYAAAARAALQMPGLRETFLVRTADSRDGIASPFYLACILVLPCAPSPSNEMRRLDPQICKSPLAPYPEPS